LPGRFLLRKWGWEILLREGYLFVPVLLPYEVPFWVSSEKTQQLTWTTGTPGTTTKLSRWHLPIAGVQAAKAHELKLEPK
jgi:hypothetical protein